MRCFALFLVVILVAAVSLSDGLKVVTKPGCPAGKKPGDKFDVKPGCKQCICKRDKDEHFCRLCDDNVRQIPGFKFVYDNSRPYPTCCYPRYVRV